MEMLKTVPQFALETLCILRTLWPLQSPAHDGIIAILHDPRQGEPELLHALRSGLYQRLDDNANFYHSTLQDWQCITNVGVNSIACPLPLMLIIHSTSTLGCRNRYGHSHTNRHWKSECPIHFLARSPRLLRVRSASR